MSQIKQDLLEVIETTMIPEVELYIKDLHEIIENKEHTEDTLEEVREMESFLVELQNIVYAINEDEIDDTQAQEVYEKIAKLVEEGEEEE